MLPSYSQTNFRETQTKGESSRVVSVLVVQTLSRDSLSPLGITFVCNSTGRRKNKIKNKHMA